VDLPTDTDSHGDDVAATSVEVVSDPEHFGHERDATPSPDVVSRSLSTIISTQEEVTETAPEPEPTKIEIPSVLSSISRIALGPASSSPGAWDEIEDEEDASFVPRDFTTPLVNMPSTH
jgi:hypothetical protein